MQPSTNRRAIVWSIDVYRQLMSQWVSAFPTSADARESHSLALEVAAAIPGRADELTSALLEARQARVLTDSAAHRVRLANTEVRLLLKTDDMEGARSLADSVLRANTTPSAYEAGYLSGLAALTGRALMASHLSFLAAAEPEHLTFYTASGNQSGLPLPLLRAALALQGYAALGGPRDSLRAAFARVEELIVARVPTTDRAEARAMLYRQSFGLAFDELAPLSRFPIAPGRNTVLAMHLALAAGDTGAVVALSGELRRRAALFAFATPDVDRLYQQARVLVAIGNDSLAARVLDDALDGIPRARRILLTAVPQAGALPRAMILRAELAQRLGDRATFERWARPAITLWSNADGELRRSVEPLRRSMQSAQKG